MLPGGVEGINSHALFGCIQHTPRRNQWGQSFRPDRSPAKRGSGKSEKRCEAEAVRILLDGEEKRPSPRVCGWVGVLVHACVVADDRTRVSLHPLLVGRLEEILWMTK